MTNNVFTLEVVHLGTQKASDFVIAELHVPMFV